MTLLSEAREDLRTAPLQVLSYEDDPRGATYGKRWQPSGEPIECAFIEMTSRERFEAGRQQTDRMVRIIVELAGTPAQSPVTERQRVRMGGRDYDVSSVRTIVASGDEGALIEAVSV